MHSVMNRFGEGIKSSTLSPRIPPAVKRFMRKACHIGQHGPNVKSARGPVNFLPYISAAYAALPYNKKPKQ